jgi:hypothetical protein
MGEEGGDMWSSSILCGLSCLLSKEALVKMRVVDLICEVSMVFHVGVV